MDSNYPKPQVIYPQPVLIREARRSEWEHQSAIYLHVPLHHSRNWHQHCHRYQACNLSVYFVRENWYNDVYAPHYNSYSNRQRNYVDYQERHYDDRHNDYRERRHSAHRDRDGHYEGRRRDKKEGGHSYDKHKDKHERGHHGKKNRDRDHDRH